MYTNKARTPQALKTRYYSNYSEVKCLKSSSSGTSRNSNKNDECAANATPKNGAKHSKIKCSPLSNMSTPPPKRFQKVRNPFEGALADRLHLPLIASPSLFQCHSRTPQLSSTQFEWDIEEVSQLKPTNVEPHETQFYDSPNPEQESKAQLAISTFFKESQIVPSPVDCPLRSRRIILSEIEGDTPISNKLRSKRVRDCEVQTELSLPPLLPKALEDALKPYLQPHLAGSTSMRNKSADIFNSSMRRKLFDLHNVIVLDGGEAQSQLTQMVGSSPQAKQTLIAGRLSDSASDGSNSFGSLSPIRSFCGLPSGTPDDGKGSRSDCKRKQLLNELELPSPIAPSEHLSRKLHSVVHSKINSYQDQSNNSEHTTISEMTGTGREVATANHCNFIPDRSSSPMQALEYSSTDSSINQRVSRLRVNSTRHAPSQLLIDEDIEQILYEENGNEVAEGDGDVAEDELETDEEDGMQISQQSMQSFNCSSSNSDTPRGHRRRGSANRKNLSQSFNANWLEEEQMQQTESLGPDKQINDELQTIVNNKNMISGSTLAPTLTTKRAVFYRTDSGFNDTSTTSTFALSQELAIASNLTSDDAALDVSMVCCSTPSTRF